MIFIWLAQTIFYISVGGILLLLSKKFLTQKEKREKLLNFVKKSAFYAKASFLKLAFSVMKITKYLNEKLKPRIRSAALLTAGIMVKTFSRLRKSFQSNVARVKSELRPIHFSKEKKEFFLHLWEKVNKTKKATPPASQEQASQLKTRDEQIPIFTRISKKEGQAPLVASFQASSVNIGLKEELQKQIVEDPIKRDILIKQEQSLLKIITLRPKDFNLYKKLGIIYKELGSFEDAKNCFEYALKLGARDRDIQKELEILK